MWNGSVMPSACGRHRPYMSKYDQEVFGREWAVHACKPSQLYSLLRKDGDR